ncbi:MULTISPECIES: DsbA family protein [unclassified Bradyrhizobium]|uniref:DsbA family protein n=1 Tax=unclassified Bradyrhizobium TaxID=2631580 RepID=UPI002916FEBE|nr:MULTISPECIES: DsbA family protein [unclassified Bradyrhizobium]
MTNLIRSVATAAAVFTLSLLCVQPGRAESSRSDIEAIVKDYIATHPEEIEQVVKDYLAKHPEAVQQAISDLIKKRQAAMPAAAPGSDKTELVKQNAPALFASAHQVTLGNPLGDVTLVEFFDYSCGYCKRALGEILELLKSDPKLKIVLKEFPILGPGSLEAARVAVAVRMQDPTGAKYLDFHQRLLQSSGPADKARAWAIAQTIGLDVAQLEKDMDSLEVRQSLDESGNLAQKLGLSGTPSYVIGGNVIVGAVGLATLKARIQQARQ